MSKTLLLALVLLAGTALTPARAGTFDLFTIPGSTISGNPGDTIGWGFQIVNNDPSNYLQIVTLSETGNFSVGTPNPDIFDADIGLVIQPGQTVTQAWVPGTAGLLELLLDGSSGTDSGDFVLDVGWYSGDPNTCGSCAVATNPTETLAPYAATQTPEPASCALGGVGTILVVLRRRRARA
jgi:hypothetical protein